MSLRTIDANHMQRVDNITSELDNIAWGVEGLPTLDVGVGELLYKISPHVTQFVGIDFDTKNPFYSLNTLNKKYPKHSFVRANWFNLPFPNETFNVVITSQCLEHLKTDKETDNFLHELWRVTRGYNGHLLIDTITDKYPDDPDHFRIYDEYRLRRDLRINDWCVEKVRNMGQFIFAMAERIEEDYGFDD